MILAVDVHYREEFAKIVSIEFDKWTDSIPTKVTEGILEIVEEYVSGEFYKRELPCILEILKRTDKSKLEVIIVDGYVELDDNGKPGLGKYLYNSLNQEIPIIGIAKRGFKDNDSNNVVKVERGKSKNPLYITSIGIGLKDSANKIKNMAGKYRVPDLLRILDQKTKEN